MKKRRTAFAPACPPNTRVLVLGSLPGEASLAAREYYAHAHNGFWRLLGGVLDRPDLATLAYSDRLATINAAGIGLWDVYASAERNGSLDQAIRLGEIAPLAELIASMPDLRAVAFNGKLAAKAGRKAIGPTALALIDLPSSSPANAVIRFDAKLERWSALKQFLI